MVWRAVPQSAISKRVIYIKLGSFESRWRIGIFDKPGIIRSAHDCKQVCMIIVGFWPTPEITMICDWEFKAVHFNEFQCIYQNGQNEPH